MKASTAGCEKFGIFFKLTEVQSQALKSLGKSLWRGCRMTARERDDYTAYLLTTIALVDVEHWRKQHDAIVHYCQHEGINAHARFAVIDDRIRAAFKAIGRRLSDAKGGGR